MGQGKHGHGADPSTDRGACACPSCDKWNGFLSQAGSLKDHGAVVVHNDAVLQVPPHCLGQHSPLEVTALAWGRERGAHWATGSRTALPRGGGLVQQAMRTPALEGSIPAGYGKKPSKQRHKWRYNGAQERHAQRTPPLTFLTMSGTVSRWVTCVTSWAMMGPQSRSAPEA